jgi:hypothetical protein
VIPVQGLEEHESAELLASKAKVPKPPVSEYSATHTADHCALELKLIVIVLDSAELDKIYAPSIQPEPTLAPVTQLVQWANVPLLLVPVTVKPLNWKLA